MLVAAASCEQYKILVLLPMAGKSHKNVFIPLVEGLAARGHDVTVISAFKPAKIIPNLTEIAIEANQHEMGGKKPPTDGGGPPAKKQEMIFQKILGRSPLIVFKGMFGTIEATCKNFLNFPTTKAMIEKGKTFDLVIVQGFVNECAVVVGTMVGKTVIYLSPPAIPGINIGATPRPPSIVPTTLIGIPAKMDFFQRLQNTVYSVAMLWSYDYYMVCKMQSTVSEILPQAPTISEALKQISFVLYNADPVLTAPHPGMSTVVAVGGMHCKDAKPLPKDFEDFIQTSGDDGFIYFSLGSGFPSTMLPEEIRQAFVSTFSRLKQKVIWKYEDVLPDQPKNVMITKWAPQQDVLGHPKIRLFISHGGLLSMQETVYHGVPVVGIPLFGDQPGNVFRIMDLKLGEQLSFDNISEAIVYSTINKVLNDKDYATNMKKYSAIFRDQPQTPLDRAIFWTEYVLRHGGAPHLRPAAEDLNFFQYFLLDVLAVLLLLLVVVTWVAVKLLKTGMNYLRKNPKSLKKNN